MKDFTVKKELLDVGKEIIKNSFGHEIPIYNRERTICDLVRSRSRFEIQDYQTALKTYIGGKGKDLNRLMECAKLFHVDKKIRGYMEVMLWTGSWYSLRSEQKPLFFVVLRKLQELR